METSYEIFLQKKKQKQKNEFQPKSSDLTSLLGLTTNL